MIPVVSHWLGSSNRSHAFLIDKLLFCFFVTICYVSAHLHTEGNKHPPWNISSLSSMSTVQNYSIKWSSRLQASLTLLTIAVLYQYSNFGTYYTVNFKYMLPYGLSQSIRAKALRISILWNQNTWLWFQTERIPRPWLCCVALKIKYNLTAIDF